MANYLNVQIKKAEIRTSPSFLSGIVRSAGYGARVAVLQERGNWAEVAYSGVVGWLHTSALTVKKIMMSAGEQPDNVAADDDEIALAGKGFNKEVEEQFKKRNANLSYEYVDYTERYTMSGSQIRSFLAGGKLKPREELV